jgi:negative regulator of sigma E activity
MMHLHHKVSALIDGELQGSARRRALAHLRRCAACRHEVEATAALKRRLLGMPPAEPSADLFASLGGVTVPPLAQRAEGRSGGIRVRRFLVGAGSLSVAVLSIAYVVGTPETTTVATVNPPVDEANADFLGAVATHPLSDPAVDTLLGDTPPTGLPMAGDSGGDDTTAQHSPDQSALALPLGPAEGDDPLAVDALQRAAVAPERFAYRGTRVIESYAEEDQTRVEVGIAHVPDQGTVLRVGGAGHDGTAVFVDRADESLAGLLGSAPVDLLESAYDLAIMGSAGILGRRTTIVGVGRDGTLVAQFWIDDSTGLIMKRELYENGRRVRSTEFTRLRIPDHAFMLHLPPSLQSPSAVVVSTSMAARLNDEGWTCPGSVGSDFTLTGLGHVDLTGDVMVARYSDGLSNVSIFEERGALSATSLSGFQTQSWGDTMVWVDYGLPTVAVWQSGGTVYTLVTDAPPERAHDVLADLPHSDVTTDVSVWSRVSTGLSRMADAVTP